MDNTHQDELKMLLKEELPNTEAIDVARLLGAHSLRNQRGVDAATRNLSVHVQAARLRVSWTRTQTVVGLVAASCAAIAMFVILSSYSVEQVTPLTPTIAANHIRPTIEVPPMVSTIGKAQTSSVRHTHTTRSFSDVNAIIVAAQEDQIVGTIANAASTVETWTISESDIDIILGDQNDGL